MQEIGTSSLWCEKYRPKKLSDLIIPQNYRDLFEKIVKEKELPNLLFSGTAGIGKSSTSYVLANELNCDLMFINASLETGIDTLRSKVLQFASTSSFKDGKKLVVLDECLEENEKIRIGTKNKFEAVPLKDLKFGTIYNTISMNMETGELENDTCELISEKEDMIYEVELDNGMTIKLNSKHPFIIKDSTGKFIEISIEDGLDLSNKIVCF